MVASQEDKIRIIDTIDANYIKLQHKDIFIFGCTMYSRDIRDALLSRGIEIKGFIDNNSKKVGKMCLGKCIEFPQDALIPYKKNALIIICSKYEKEMQRQLESFGYGDESMLFIGIEESGINVTDDIIAAEKAFQHVMMGMDVYGYLKEKSPHADKIFLCPYPGTGDVYMACTYLPAYLSKEKINKYSIVVTKNICKMVCEMFGQKNVLIISQEQMNDILAAWTFDKDTMKEIKPLLHWGWRVKRYLYADNYDCISFNEMFQYDVFGLSVNAKKTKPSVKNADVKKYFEKAGFKRAIILAPYAGSFVSDIPMAAWVEIAELLLKKGYIPYTNCQSKEEVIPGTEQVFFPYSDGISCLEYCAGMIALRSGLCDVLSSAESKMIILYEEGFNAAQYDFFGMVKMGIRKAYNTTEYVYSGNYKELIRRIDGCFECI